MDQLWPRRPFDQTPADYEERIQHLEDVVHLLLAKQETTLFPVSPSAPLAGSFRYSVDRGLVPLLSKKTARSLAINWRNNKPKGGSPLFRPPSQCLPFFQPAMSSLGQVITADKSNGIHPASTRSPSCFSSLAAAASSSLAAAASTTSSAAAASTTSSAAAANAPSLTTISAISDRSANKMELSEVINAPSSSTHRSPPPALNGALSHLRSNRGLDLTLPSSSLPLACSPSSSSSIGASPPPRSDHLLALAPVNVSDAIHTTTSPPSRLIPSLSPRTAEQANTSAVATVTLATIQHPILEATAELPSPSTAIPPPSPAANKPLRSLTLTEALAHPACRSRSNSTSRSKSHSRLRSPTDPPSLSMEVSDIIITATTTSSPSSSRFSSPLAPIQDHLAETSLPVCSDFNIAAIGSITIVDDTIESPEHQLAPEDSDEDLQFNKDCQDYYNDILEYESLLNTENTEVKKKKKKKKKKKASNPTAAPNNSNPTSTPNNPVLFYV